MENQTRIDIHQEVEYIKQDPEFPFDTHDEIEDILEHYKINMPENPELRKIIEREIRAIAEQHQTAEIVHTINSEQDDTPQPGVKTMQQETLESIAKDDTTESENTDKKQPEVTLTPEQQNVRNYINTARETLHQHKVNKAIQRAIETKPPEKTPTIRKLTIWPIPIQQHTEYRTQMEGRLRSKIRNIEKRIDEIEGRFNYHIHLLGGLAHNI